MTQLFNYPVLPCVVSFGTTPRPRQKTLSQDLFSFSHTGLAFPSPFPVRSKGPSRTFFSFLPFLRLSGGKILVKPFVSPSYEEEGGNLSGQSFHFGILTTRSFSSYPALPDFSTLLPSRFSTPPLFYFRSVLYSLRFVSPWQILLRSLCPPSLRCQSVRRAVRKEPIACHF
jgi:hypothetical protein